MTLWNRICGLPAWSLIIPLLIILALAILGCDDAQRIGSAQHASIEAAAHAKASRTAAETADVDASIKEARAAELAVQAERLPTDERIAAAADARVDAASARAVSNALIRVADSAETRAQQAVASANAERQREAKAAADASWLSWCRMIALGCTVAGAVLGFLIGYLTKDPRAGMALGGGLIGIGLVVLAFGVALPWLAWLVPIGLCVTVGWWAIQHRRLNTAFGDAVAFGSEAIDTVKAGISQDVSKDIKDVHTLRQIARGTNGLIRGALGKPKAK